MIHIQNAVKNYGEFQLNANLDIPKNSITALLGLNGSGKTTLFRLLTGLMKPDSGIVNVFDQNAWTLSKKQKEEIGVVLSESTFIPSLTVEQIKKVLKAFYSSFDANYYDRLVNRFNLPKNQEIQNYSTGMKVRLKVISALSHHPKLLLLDEPTAGLDVAARNEILDLLREYMENPEHSILISSHISSDLENFCDDFYLISSGRIVLHEDVETLNDGYGIVHILDQDYNKVDLQQVIRQKKTRNGTDVLVKDIQFYEENYPWLAVEHGNIDDLLLMYEGESV